MTSKRGICIIDGEEKMEERTEGRTEGQIFTEYLIEFKNKFDTFKKVSTSLIILTLLVICLQFGIMIWFFLKIIQVL